ncbi:L-lactate dehydrogenase [Phormidium yuhuli AB48]|uniref:L-lactate dehydrogenase n=1 Tax=Phormidium yuhuli AB48 TaxID=2940671 RepID=A0ABY5AMH7_9CYAN|nr:L-lactate dehydrogenase [Phormidium yuhuli]USR89976.1 L-lactate dehydrogenase [Phormidium yuhuli AB48]
MFEQLFTTLPDPQFRALQPRKAVIVGAGQVGMACAYSLLIQNCFDELVLQDLAREKVEGEVMDLAHGLPFVAPTAICAGTVAEEGRNADIVIITAGAAQKPGETRLDLVQKNVAIFRQLIPEIAESCPEAILLIVTNPVDIMTYVSLKLSGFSSSRVLGSGTVLDTARFRSLLARELRLDARSLHAYIIGEHGDSEVPVWSKVNIAGMPLCDGDWQGSPSADDPRLQRIFQETRDAAYEIIRRKGYTSYAIGLGVTDIVQSILRDQNRVMTVSSLVHGVANIDDVCLSLPTVVNRQGADRMLQLSLTPQESRQLEESANVMTNIIKEVSL